MRVLQLIDSLHSGGAERVAVNFANALVKKIDKSYLCTTRQEGVLKSSLNSQVDFLFLKKRSVIDIKAIKILNRFIKVERIDIIHAHSTSFFLATIIKILNKKIKVIWHDHYGNSEFLHKRKSRGIKLCSKYFDFIFCVNKNLEHWAKKYLKFKNVLYLSNFAVLSDVKPQTGLLGLNGKRIVCLANLREQKDHFTLIKAFKEVLKKHPDWSLHLVGKDFLNDYSKKLKRALESNNLANNVFLYGSRPDIENILSQCEMGLLSSKSEGLPLAILEYGLSKLPVICTNVGECESVIESESYGILVNTEDEKELHHAINNLIENKNERLKMAFKLNQKVREEFSQDVIMKIVINIYKKIY
jgi:glycosyltransferase involved in cell wall biosynthesis